MDFLNCKCCRLCGKENKDLIPIFDRKNLVENIARFLHIQVFVEDFLPHNICSACDAEVQHIVQFIEHCQTTQRELYSFKFDQHIEIPPDPIKIECSPSRSVEDDIADVSNWKSSVNENVESILPEKPPAVFNLEGQKVEVKVPRVVLHQEKTSCTDRKISGHSRQKKKVYQCMECPLSTPFRYRLNQHQKEVHSKTFSCDQCEKQYGKASKLKQHKMTEHTDRSPLISCKLCNAKFTQRYLYALHLKTHMSNGSFWPCDECGQQFTQMHRLDLHKAKRHQSKDLSCNQCSFIANHEYALKQHIREVHKKSFQCDICQKQESKKSRILSHIQKKHMEKEKYRCKYCTAEYQSKKWFEHHIKTCPGANISNCLFNLNPIIQK